MSATGRLGLLLPLLLAACDASPAQNVLGSYFPSWLICAIAGVIAAAVLRQLLIIAGLNQALLLAPAVYVCLAVAAGLLTWLFLFGQ